MQPETQTYLVPLETKRHASTDRCRAARVPKPGDIDHPETHHRRAIEKDPRAGLILDPGFEPYEKARVEPPTELESSWRHGHWRVHRQLTWESLRRLNPLAQSTYRFARCGARAMVARDKESGTFRIQSFGCKSRVCSACRKRAAGTIANNVINHAIHGDRRKDGHKIRSVTLTLRHDDSPLSNQLTRILQSFAKLRKSKIVKKCFIGGFYVVETKVSTNDGSWHTHMHIITEGLYTSFADLRDEWLRITKDSYRVRINLVSDIQNEVGHHCKYLTKAADASIYRSAAKLDEFITATHGRRLAGTFGSWRGLRVARPTPVKGEWVVVGYLDFIAKEAGRGDERSLFIMKMLREDRDRTRGPPTTP